MTRDSASAAVGAASTRLGRYEVLGRVGMGGMAEVFLAREADGALDRWVAIKRIHPELAKQKKFVRMLLDEARLAARIAHPNVAQVLDLGEADGLPYIVMEYLHGQPLSEVIRRACEDGGSPELDLMARIVADAAEGAHSAHELRGADGKKLGLVHRDLSPHNVFVTYDGAVKVVDFGVAKARGRLTLTEPGIVKGKFAYMSPEQARGGKIDRRSDVYALGLVLYEATTGVQVFEGGSLEVLARIDSSRFRPPSRQRRGYPAELERVVMRALSASQEERFQTARDLAQELERFIVGRRALTDPAQVASMMAALFPDQRAMDPSGRVASDPSWDQGRPPTTTTASARPQAPLPTVWWTKPLFVVCFGTIIGCLVAVGLILSGQLDRHEPVRSQAIVDDSSGSHAGPAREGAAGGASARTGRAITAPASAEGSSVRTLKTASSDGAAGSPATESPSRAADPLSDASPESTAPAAPFERPSSRPGSRKGQGRAVGSADQTAVATPREGAGTLDVRSEPWSMVSVDGREIQPTPMVGLPLSAGTHTLRLVGEDGRTKRLRVRITSGRASSIHVRF